MRILLLFGLVLLVFMGTAQVPASVTSAFPMKGANVVLVQTPDSPSVALTKLGQVLVARGYTVQRLDESLHTLRSDPKTIPKGFRPNLTVIASAKGGVLTLRGQYTIDAGTAGTVSSPAQFSGVNGAANKLTFAELQEIARAYPSGQIRYQKQ
jgi:hypothetical protein